MQTDSSGAGQIVGYLSIAMPRNAVGGSSQIFLADQLRALAMAVALALAVSAIAAYFLSRQFVGASQQFEGWSQTPGIRSI